MSRFIRMLHKDESGQDLVEYSLVLIAVAGGVVAGSATLSGDFSTWMTSLKTKIDSSITGGS